MRSTFPLCRFAVFGAILSFAPAAAPDDLDACGEETTAAILDEIVAETGDEAAAWIAGDGDVPPAIAELVAAMGCALPDDASFLTFEWVERLDLARGWTERDTGSFWAMLLPSVEIRWSLRREDSADSTGGMAVSAGSGFEIWLVWSGPVGWP